MSFEETGILGHRNTVVKKREFNLMNEGWSKQMMRMKRNQTAHSNGEAEFYEVNGLEAMFWNSTHRILTGVVEEKYTTSNSSNLR